MIGLEKCNTHVRKHTSVSAASSVTCLLMRALEASSLPSFSRSGSGWITALRIAHSNEVDLFRVVCSPACIINPRYRSSVSNILTYFGSPSLTWSRQPKTSKSVVFPLQVLCPDFVPPKSAVELWSPHTTVHFLIHSVTVFPLQVPRSRTGVVRA